MSFRTRFAAVFLAAGLAVCPAVQADRFDRGSRDPGYGPGGLSDRGDRYGTVGTGRGGPGTGSGFSNRPAYSGPGGMTPMPGVGSGYSGPGGAMQAPGPGFPSDARGYERYRRGYDGYRRHGRGGGWEDWDRRGYDRYDLYDQYDQYDQYDRYRRGR